MKGGILLVFILSSMAQAQRHNKRIRLKHSGGSADLIRIRQLHLDSNAMQQRIQHVCDTHSFIQCHTWKTLHYVVVHGQRTQNNPYVLFVFGQHARELFSSTTALAFIENIARHRPKANIIILPNVNPIQRDKVLRGELCLRKNEHGVDLNRAYALPEFATFVQYGQDSEEYQGDEPMTEVSTQLVDFIVTSYPTRMVVNVHTGEFSAYVGGSDSSMTMHEPRDQQHVEITKKVVADLCPQCVVGPAASTSTYTATGTLCDYLKFIRHVPVAITFEIFGDFDRGKNCFEWFNPKTRADQDKYMRKWIMIFQRLVDPDLMW